MFTGPNLISKNIVWHLDVGNVKSYPLTGSIIYDLSDNKIHVTAVSASFHTGSKKALRFNPSVSGSINDNNWPANLQYDDNTTPRSWEVFCKPNDNTRRQGIFGHKTGIGCSYYCNGGFFLDSNGEFSFNWYDNTTYHFMSSGVKPQEGKWYHVVGTFDTSDRKPRIYINGELKATFSTATEMDYSNGIDVYDIGFNSKDGGKDYFDGDIAIMRMYQKGLTLEDIQRNFNAQKNRFGI